MDSNAAASLNLSRIRLIGYRTFAEVIGRLCAFAVVILAARTLPTAEFGIFSLAWTSGWLISILGDLGLQIHLTRQVALHPESADRIFRQLLIPRLLLVGTLLAASAGTVWMTVPASLQLPVLAIVTSHLLVNLLEFFNHLFRGLERSHWEASLNLLLRSSALALAALLVFSRPGLAAFGIALQVSAWISLSAAAWLTFRQVSLAASRAERGFWRPPRLWSQLRGIGPIGLGILLSALYFRLDIFVLEAFWGSRSVGLYSAVFRLVDASRLFPAAAMAVVFPLLCRPGRELVFRQTMAGLGALSVVLAVGGWWLADEVVTVFFGKKFLETAPVFQLLLLSLPLFFLNFVLTHRLIADGMQRAFAWICAGGLLSSVALTLLLVPGFSLEGAAWACFLREGLISGACCWILRRGIGNNRE